VTNTQPDQRFDALGKLLRPISVAGWPLVMLMLVAPRAELTRRIMGSTVIFTLLGGVYTALAVRSMLKDPATVKEIVRLEPKAVARYMGDRDGAITVWTHMTTSDLFIARWIYLDSLERGAPARLFILTQFLAGPVGLLGYLLVGRRAERRSGSSTSAAA
jgi:hypothetical protein